jgi:hypothetical protein
MSLSQELQRVIYERLVADAGVHAVVEDRIYDNRPAAANFPCVTFGPSDSIEDDAECITGAVETLQIDCWARENGRIAPVKPVVDAVKKALHLKEIDLVAGSAVEVRVTMTRAFMDPDGLTAHGVVMVQVIIEEAA